MIKITRLINKYNDIFQDVLPRNFIYKDLYTQIHMYQTAMILNDQKFMNTINYKNSAFNLIPDVYTKLSTENKYSIYMQVYHKQQKDLAWQEKEKLDQELKEFGMGLEDLIMDCEELEEVCDNGNIKNNK